ncbi:MAG TPA: class I SAM-dependent methyltransferase [Thermoanaerobaculia bacterium]|nr:class I SAM-dependent methyltransferase [Thermoanaerobaculia bacterium]
MTSDPYSRFEYRRLIAWSQRIEREAPLLEKILSSGPSRRVLDLGCGSGEHSRWLAAHDFDVVGVDASESMLDAARDTPVPENLRFVLGDFRNLPETVDGAFGGAICLGNVLPHLRAEEDLVRLTAGLRSRLLPGAPFLLQILNYDRIFAKKERTLPVNFRPDPEGEIVFLRLMEPREDGTVLFFPTTLLLRPGHQPPLEVKHAREVELRGWKRREVETILEREGFRDFTAWGGFDESPWEETESRDLILLAR